jgi:hypothetical protein
MSVTLINIFEVPAGDEDEFIAAWEKTRDYLKTFPAHIETALHQANGTRHLTRSKKKTELGAICLLLGLSKC